MIQPKLMKPFLNSIYFKLIFNLLVLIYLYILNHQLFNLEEKPVTLIIITFITYLLLVVLNSISQLLYKIFIIVFIIVSFPILIIQKLIGKIEYENIVATYFTNSTESLSYLKVVPFDILLLAFSLVLPLLIILYVKPIVINKKIASGILVFICLFSVYKFFSEYNFYINKGNYNHLYKTIYISPFRKIAQISGLYYLVEKDYKKQIQLQEKPSSWEILENNIEDKVTVFIIGESVRKDFLQIYNPKLLNTPFLEKVNKIQFNNTISYGAHTLESLSYAFQAKENGKPYFPNNIITLANKAGYITNWISNQGSIGEYDNHIAAMGNQANYTKFLSKGSYLTAQKDNKLLDVFKERIDSSKKSIYFLHTIGSHPFACDITDGEYSKFIKSESISCYVESIKRTDDLIKNVYDILKSKKKEFRIVYFSDHGQYITPKLDVFHNNDYKQSYDVPLIVIDSELKESVYIEQQRNLKDFMSLYQELLNIKTKNINTDYKFISEEIDNDSDLLYNNLHYKKLKDNSLKL